MRAMHNEKFYLKEKAEFFNIIIDICDIFHVIVLGVKLMAFNKKNLLYCKRLSEANRK